MAGVAVTKERLQERTRKSGDLDNGHHKGSRHFPESRLRKMLVPEDPPASDGASVGAKKFRELPDSPGRRALLHGSDQGNYGGEVNLSAEKPHRRRSRPLATAVALAAKTEPGAVLFG